jgi:hypothetical protein
MLSGLDYNVDATIAKFRSMAIFLRRVFAVFADLCPNIRLASFAQIRQVPQRRIKKAKRLNALE